MATREWHARRLAAMEANPRDPQHGTSTGYYYGCRCRRCRAAYQEYRDRGHVSAANERLARLMEAAGPRIVRVHGVGEIEI